MNPAAVLALALVGGLGCRVERPSLVRVGDAVPRSLTDSTLLDVVRPLMEVDGAVRVDIAPWTVKAIDLGVGEAEQARIFIDDPSVIAVVGHSGSKSTLLAAPMYHAAGMPLIVPTSTARALRAAGPGIFMLAPPDDAIGAFLVDRALDSLGARRVGILHVADPYGDGIRDGVVARMRARGDTLVGEAALSGRECDAEGLAMDAVVRAFLQRARPDAVIIALPQKSAWCAIRRLVREQPGIVILASDSFVDQHDFPLTASERAHVYSLVFWEPGTDSLTQRFLQRARAVWEHDPEPAQALSFDAFRLVAAAVREGHVTRQSVGDWLRQLGTPGHPPFQGITGPIDFTAPRTSVLRLKKLGTRPPDQ